MKISATASISPTNNSKANQQHNLTPIDRSKLKKAPPSVANNLNLDKHGLPKSSSFSSPEEYKSHMEEQGTKKDIAAIFYKEGELIATAGYDGSTTSKYNYNFGRLNTSNISLDVIIKSIKSHLGHGVYVEQFKAGEGPTNAEIYKEIYGKDYQDFIDREYRIQKAHEATDRKRKEALNSYSYFSK